MAHINDKIVSLQVTSFWFMACHISCSHAELCYSVMSQAPGSPVFRVGDRVIQGVNNYEQDVFNGDPGFVTVANPAARRIAVQFAGPTGSFLSPLLWFSSTFWGFLGFSGVFCGFLGSSVILTYACQAYGLLLHDCRVEGTDRAHLNIALYPHFLN